MSGPNRTLKLSYVGDTKRLDKANKDATSGLSKLGGSFKKFGKVAAIGAAAAGTAVLAAAGSIFKAAESTAAANDKILKSSLKVGAAADKYQELQYWAGQNGVESDNLSRALGRLNQRMAKADDETKGYGKAFADLGVTVRGVNGEMRTSDEVFADTIASLRAIESPAERSAKAAEVFGTKLARDLMPALNDASLSIDEAAARAQELGLVMDQDALEASARFGDALKDVRDSVTALKNKALGPVIEFFADTVLPMILDKVIPALQDLAQRIGPYIQKFIEKTVDVFGRWMVVLREQVIPVVRQVIGRVVEFVKVIREWWQRVSPGVLQSFEKLKQPLIDVWTAIKDAWTNVKELFAVFRNGESDGKGFERFIERLVTVLGIVLRVIRFLINGFSKFLDLLRRIGESKTFQALASGIGTVTSGIKSLIPGLAEGGIVTKPTLAMIGEGGESEAVIPLSKMGSMGGGSVNITINGAIDPEGTARQIRRILEDSQRRTGARLAYAG